MGYQEAIEVLANEIGCVDLDTNNRGYIDESEKKFMDACNTAISAMRELQLYKDGKLCLIPESVYSKQCTELDAFKQLGTLEEVGEAVEKQKNTIGMIFVRIRMTCQVEEICVRVLRKVIL